MTLPAQAIVTVPGTSPQSLGAMPSRPLFIASGSVITVANTTAETVIGSAPIPAAALAAGQLIKIKRFGVYSTTTIAPTIIGKTKLGSTTILTTPLLTCGISLSNMIWWSESWITIKAIGSSGSIEAHGSMSFATALNAAVPVNPGNAEVIAIDLSADLILSDTVQWGASSPNNKISQRQMAVEIMGP